MLDVYKRQDIDIKNGPFDNTGINHVSFVDIDFDEYRRKVDNKKMCIRDRGLNGSTPYDAALETLGKETLNAFQLKRIDPDLVNLTPVSYTHLYSPLPHRLRL